MSEQTAKTLCKKVTKLHTTNGHWIYTDTQFEYKIIIAVWLEKHLNSHRTNWSEKKLNDEQWRV